MEDDGRFARWRPRGWWKFVSWFRRKLLGGFGTCWRSKEKSYTKLGYRDLFNGHPFLWSTTLPTLCFHYIPGDPQTSQKKHGVPSNLTWFLCVTTFICHGKPFGSLVEGDTMTLWLVTGCPLSQPGENGAKGMEDTGRADWPVRMDAQLIA